MIKLTILYLAISAVLTACKTLEGMGGGVIHGG